MKDLIEAIRNARSNEAGRALRAEHGLLFTLAKRYRGIDNAVDMDDLMQAGFLGLLAAVGAWEPDRGAWSTIASLYATKAMREALGIRSTRQRAHLGAVSLDAPIGEEGDATRADLLADESLPDADTALLENDRRAAVRAAVGRLEGRKRAVVEWHDLEGQTLALIGDGLGVSFQRVKQLREKAFTDLRRDRQLRRALDDETLYYQHWA
jgi:RNA polymerase sigma factor (sigma-70 family)